MTKVAKKPLSSIQHCCASNSHRASEVLGMVGRDSIIAWGYRVIQWHVSLATASI